MGRLVIGAHLAVPEDAGEQRERRRQATPQVALVRVGARVQQQARDAERRGGGHVGVDA
jgi:hypothetical protein